LASTTAGDFRFSDLQVSTMPRITLSFAMIALLVAGATASAQNTSDRAPRNGASTAGTSVVVPMDYVIGAEDVLGIMFWREQEMSGDVTVRPDGKVTLPLLGDIQAAGTRPDALRDQITQAAGKYLTDVNVTVVVRQINSRKVFITGQVTTPGAYPLTGPRTVMQLIALAGGLTEYADGESISIMRQEQGKTRSMKFNYRDVSKGKKLEQNVMLLPGDTVVVP
jgi:polysaccharide export outer membrane protein